MSVPPTEVEKQSNKKNKNRENNRNRDENGEDVAVEVMGRRGSGLREEEGGNVGRESGERRERRRWRRRGVG